MKFFGTPHEAPRVASPLSRPLDRLLVRGILSWGIRWWGTVGLVVGPCTILAQHAETHAGAAGAQNISRDACAERRDALRNYVTKSGKKMKKK